MEISTAEHKKILFICNHLFGGGAERVLVTLANYFSENGYRVSIIVFDGQKRYPLHSDISVVEIGDSSSLLKQSSRIRKALKNDDSDVIISFEYFVNLATILGALGKHRKVIVSERSDPSRVGNGFGKKQIRNILYSFCHYLVCQTPEAKHYFPRRIQKHSVIIANPIREGLPNPWNGEREHQVVNFCRLNEAKNLKLLIDAFKDFASEYPDYTLRIYGDGEEKNTVAEYIKSVNMENKVFLFPNMPDVHVQVLKSMMFVSSSNYEGLSNSMLEALAIGLPTICTDCPCGGSRMIINDGENGLLVPVKNREELTNAMRRVASSPELAQRLSENAKTIRLELSTEKISSLWSNLF